MHTAILFLTLAAAPDARDSDARAALALAGALPRQAPLPPQAPAVRVDCGCHGGGDCYPCGEGCDCVDLRHANHAAYEWRYSDVDELALYRDGKQIGAWNYAYGYYRPLAYEVHRDGHKVPKWGEKCRPPTDVPPPSFFAPPQSYAPSYLPAFAGFQGGAYCPPGASS